MILTQDLMIGNFINTERYGIVPITSILSSSVWVLSDGYTATVSCHIKNNDFQPVELTPTILTDWCGFKMVKKEYGTHYIYGRILIEELEDNPTYARLIWDNEHSLFICELKYLHQLQNLIKIFFSKELEINIPKTVI